MTAGGRFGGVLAGLGFMLPGFVLMFALSWFYVTYGMSLPLFKPVFHGFQVAVGGTIVRAIHRIGGHSLTDVTLWIVAGLAAIGEITGVPFFISLPVLGLHLFPCEPRAQGVPGYLLGVLFVAGIFLFWQYAAPQGAVVSAGTQNLSLRAASLPELFLSGLRSGLLTFGGAYTVITFLQHDAVNVQNWMTNAQFLDGLALSGILPAPPTILHVCGLFLGGAVRWPDHDRRDLSSAFAFTLIGHNVMEKAIDSPRLHAFLEGVTAAVVGLMAVITVKLLEGRDCNAPAFTGDLCGGASGGLPVEIEGGHRFHRAGIGCGRISDAPVELSFSDALKAHGQFMSDVTQPPGNENGGKMP